jgi:hypothetical protein
MFKQRGSGRLSHTKPDFLDRDVTETGSITDTVNPDSYCRRNLQVKPEASAMLDWVWHKATEA